MLGLRFSEKPTMAPLTHHHPKLLSAPDFICSLSIVIEHLDLPAAVRGRAKSKKRSGKLDRRGAIG